MMDLKEHGAQPAHWRVMMPELTKLIAIVWLKSISNKEVHGCFKLRF
jgi:hypothetical protein